MYRWFVKLAGFSRPVLSAGDEFVHPKFGRGTVVSGSITIKYDRAPAVKEYRHENEKTWTHSLEEFNEGKVNA